MCKRFLNDYLIVFQMGLFVSTYLIVSYFLERMFKRFLNNYFYLFSNRTISINTFVRVDNCEIR